MAKETKQTAITYFFTEEGTTSSEIKRDLKTVKRENSESVETIKKSNDHKSNELYQTNTLNSIKSTSE